MTEIVEQLGLPKATVFRILSTLEHAGWVLREPSGKDYTAGSRLARFGIDIVMNNSVRMVRHAILARVANDIGETCNLTVLDGNQVLYVDRVETRWPLKMDIKPGAHVPLHCSASGKLFLSMMNRSKRSALLENLQLTRYTDRTITDPALLAAELDRIHASQVALNNEESISGLIGVAVPVPDARGRIAFALAIQAPRTRLSMVDAMEHIPYLRRAAEAIAATLGPGSAEFEHESLKTQEITEN
ncbi:MAG: IclR family transcriptional regulator [Collimonas sp.]